MWACRVIYGCGMSGQVIWRREWEMCNVVVSGENGCGISGQVIGKRGWEMCDVGGSDGRFIWRCGHFKYTVGRSYVM